MGKIILSQGLALGLSLLLLLALSGPPDNVGPLNRMVFTHLILAAPTISDIPNQTLDKNQTTGPITFTITDADTPIEALTLSAQTSNAALIPTSHIIFGGSGMTRTIALTPTKNIVGSAVISVGVSDGVNTTYEGFIVTVLEHLYLPLAMHNYVPTPDLIVTQISVGTHNISVTIKNQGDSPVDKAFWVDAYINPDPIPTRVNQTWEQVSTYGMVWGLRGSALPMAPGKTYWLTIDDEYYAKDRSRLTKTLPIGTIIYAQVDSYDNRTTYGAVLEQHERAGGVYNNIIGITTTITCSLTSSWHDGNSKQLWDDKNWLSTNWRDKDWASLRYAPWRAVIHNSKATPDAYNVQKTGPICCLTPQIWGDPKNSALPPRPSKNEID